jgi:Cellulose synthase subunit D
MVINMAREATDLPVAVRSVPWRTFLGGLATELEAQAGPDGSAAILRGIGQQMAKQSPLMPAESMEALELDMNLLLDEIGWGHVQLQLQEAERCVIIVHSGLPQVSSAGKPPGTWLAPVLEGLYKGWMGQQPGADGALCAMVDHHEHNTIFIRYGR